MSFVLGLSVLCGAVACSGEDPQNEAAATDGTAGAAGTTDQSTSDLTSFRWRRSSTGGTTATGGKTATGGTTATGGATATGGTLMLATGGTTVSTGGTGSTNVTNSNARINVVASRTACAAPCAVFFDGTNVSGLSGATGLLPGGDYVGATYRWSFSDPGSPHATTTGFSVAHVFESPGTYSVSVDVIDAAGIGIPRATVTVTVSAMSGTTYYVSTSGNDSNSGTSTTSAFKTLAHAMSLAKANTSVLMRKGDTFPSSSTITVALAGPLLIGSYSDPALPSSAAPILTFTGSAFNVSNSSDIRFADLHTRLQGANDTIDIGTATNVLLLRVEAEGTPQTATETSQIYTGPTSDGVFVVDSHVHNFYGYAWYAEGPVRVALIGSTIDQLSGLYHAFRFQGCQSPIGSPTTCSSTGSRRADTAYVAGNTIDTPAAYDSGTFRGSMTNIEYIGNYATNYVGVNPQNTGSIEYLSNALVDGNFMTGPADGVRLIGVSLAGKHIVLRNNVVNAPNNTAFTATNQPQLQAGWIDEIFAFNNTVMSSQLLSWGVSTVGTVTLRNNIVYNTSPYDGFLMSGSASFTEDHNLTYAANGKGWVHPTGAGDVYGDPVFVSAAPKTATDYQLSTTSPARGTGVSVGAYVDYSEAARSSAFNRGAF